MSVGRLKDILFIDIETVRGFDTLEEVPGRVKDAWMKKAMYFQRTEEQAPEDLYTDKAGILAEFGKIVVIGMGYFHQDNEQVTLRMKSIYGNDEAEILDKFREILSRFDQENLKLCAHNGKSFDFPFISRRMIIHGIALPEALRLAGKKPWEINHLDTMEMWRFGDYRHFVSLELLAALLNIESSKTNLDGSQVGKTFYEEGDIDSIASYCLKDVEVTARVYLHLIGEGDKNFKTINSIQYLKPDNNNE